MLLDQLEDEDRKIIYKILESVMISGDVEKVFKGLLKKNRIDRLQQEVDKINSIIRYAGGNEENSDKIEALMRRSMELQMEIAKEKVEEY